jgi:chromate transport protein ChrA
MNFRRICRGARHVPIRLSFHGILAPYFKKYGRRPDIHAFVNGVTVAAVGVIAGSAVVLGRRSITDWPAALLALGTLQLCWKVKQISAPIIVVFAASLGITVGTWHRSSAHTSMRRIASRFVPIGSFSRASSPDVMPAH